MIRLFHVYFPGRTLVLAVSEAVLVGLALLAAFFARFGNDAGLALTYEHGIIRIAIACIVFMLCMHYYDLYDSLILQSPAEVMTRLLQALGTASVVLALIYYAYPDIQLGRGPFVIWIVFSGIVLAGWRRLFLTINRSLRLGQRSLLLGEGPMAVSLASEIGQRPELGLNLLGYVQRVEADSDHVKGLPCLGHVDELAAVVQRERISRIILTMEDRRGHLPVEALLRLKAQGLVIQDGADVYEAVTGRITLDSLRPSWLLFSDGFCVSRFILIYKRLASIILSSLGLLVASPLMLLVAIAIRLDSKGPVIFRQKRVGQGGRIFTVYKFRSMRVDADNDGVAKPVQENDPRITAVGRWIRRLRVDELPQLYNILRGDMYFIGPRPFIPNLEEEYAKKIPFYAQRWTVKPGATGWAQIRRGYCASLEDNIEKLEYDLFYIKNISIGLDCLILFETLKTLLLGRGSR